ncbi:MAG: hypothetical protein AB2556_17145, partial [Candidatus Thiodiazotropha sp.]
RKGEEDQLYAFQLAGGVYKRKEGIISSDGATSMDGNLDLGGNRIVNLKYPDASLAQLRDELSEEERALESRAATVGDVRGEINRIDARILAQSGVPGPQGPL